MKIGTFEGKVIFVSEHLEKKLRKKLDEGYKIIINKDNLKPPKKGAEPFLNNWSGKDKLNYSVWLIK